MNCSALTKNGGKCPHDADRNRNGVWFCHVHDPDGVYQRQHHKKSRYANLAKKNAKSREKWTDVFGNTPLESRHQLIPFPPETEFEVQAFIYNELRSHGIVVRGEVRTRCGSCKFDLVVYCPLRRARVIIETKNGRSVTARLGRVKTRAQVRRYSEYGLPVLVVRGMKEAAKACSQVVSMAGDWATTTAAEHICHQ